MQNWFDVGTPDEFSESCVSAVQAGGQAVAVFRVDGELFALRDKCSHGNARLSEGYIEDGCVECPLHQGLIDIRSGAPKTAPITEPVRTFPVRVVAGRVEVDVTESTAEQGGTECNHECGVRPTAAAREESREVSALIHSIEKVSSDVVVMRLRQEGGASLSYAAGQYLDVVLENGCRRSYSMATPAGGNMLELHIRHLPGGVFTDQVFGSLRTGQTLKLDGPAGDFYLRSSTRPVVLLASGTGFAPIKAIVENAIATGNTRPMHLYWGGRKPADLYLNSLCREWAERLPWFEYVPVISEPAAGGEWSGRTGLVHQAVLQDYDDLREHEVYACGAPQMVAAAQSDFSYLRSLPLNSFFANAHERLEGPSRV